MTKVFVIDDYMKPDQLGCSISERYVEWENYRQAKVAQWKETQEYIFATDTTQTTNSKLPWSNKTTVPKLCQIRDNLYANYMATMFPKRKWLVWEGMTRADEDADKKKAIESYMQWAIDRPEFYQEVSKTILDYIDYGNAFLTTDWLDLSTVTPDGRAQVGYVGPTLRRISPLDIVFNPAAPSFVESPKIIRSIVSIGEVKAMLEKAATPEDQAYAQDLWNYMNDLRQHVSQLTQTTTTKDAIYSVAGFTDYQSYLGSEYVEILTFYGDMYDSEKAEYYRNYVIKVVDRHKVLSKEPNPSFFGTTPIYHVGWRIRPDNLWAMGPLDNLVGMQYRIDHLENMKSDVFDLIAYPPLKITGYVEDFEWGPMERIYVGDTGNVELMSPDAIVLQADNQISILEMKMEEMAGSPKEAMGFRTPGEKTKYEVQRLENAASRIFQNKTAQFESTGLEPALNAMLELARRNMVQTQIRIFSPEDKIAFFRDLTVEDITGQGRIRPVAARHFAEKADQVQNLTAFFSSVPGSDPSILAHFSSVRLARVWEDILEIEEFKVVEPYIRLSEQAEAQQLQAIQAEHTATTTSTPGGILPGDYDQAASAQGDIDALAGSPPQGGPPVV